jgi:hypothetical protein
VALPVFDVIPSSRIREHAAARAAVEGIAPQRLHREHAGGERDVRRSALPRGDPGALVAVLGAAGVQPTGARELVVSKLFRDAPILTSLEMSPF